MSDIAITRDDIERVRKIARRKKDEWEGDEVAEHSADMLEDFCDVLLGHSTLNGFLISQDMDT